jgi:hypothetical protein
MDHWGKDGDDVLVFSADTLSLNPTVNAQVITRSFEEDPARAASEYGQDGLVTFRQDVEAFLSRETVEAVVVSGRRELPPMVDARYTGYVDVSGGSQDSYAMAIGHVEKGVAVIDVLRETRPPFSPEQVTEQYAALLKTYRVLEVRGDKYAGEFPRELYRKHGITYIPADLTTSDTYREFLPVVNAGKVQLLDHAKLVTQLLQLERRVARSGRDSIAHPVGAHDDLATAVAGCAIRALEGKAVALVGPAMVEGPPRWDHGRFGADDSPQYRSATDYPVRRGRFDW